VAHNGIIENHDEIRGKLQAKGYEFVTETDTEVIAHLVHSHYAAGSSLFDAVRRSVAALVGAYAIAVIAEAETRPHSGGAHGCPAAAGIARRARASPPPTPPRCCR